MCTKFGIKSWVYDAEQDDWVCSVCKKPTPSRGIFTVPGYTIDNEQPVFRKIETCGLDDCTPRELYLSKRVGKYIGVQLDSKGFWWCGFCLRIMRDQLVECPECGNFFRGPDRFFVIDYECEKCG